MTPDSMESYRAIQASLLGLEKEIGELRAEFRGIASSIESSVEQRQIARQEHTFCRASIEKRMDKFEADTDGRITEIEEQNSKLLTWGKAIALIGGATAAILVVLNILQAIGYQV